jgi:hypothetical protein
MKKLQGDFLLLTHLWNDTVSPETLLHPPETQNPRPRRHRRNKLDRVISEKIPLVGGNNQVCDFRAKSSAVTGQFPVGQRRNRHHLIPAHSTASYARLAIRQRRVQRRLRVGRVLRRPHVLQDAVLLGGAAQATTALRSLHDGERRELRPLGQLEGARHAAARLYRGTRRNRNLPLVLERRASHAPLESDRGQAELLRIFPHRKRGAGDFVDRG